MRVVEVDEERDSGHAPVLSVEGEARTFIDTMHDCLVADVEPILELLVSNEPWDNAARGEWFAEVAPVLKSLGRDPYVVLHVSEEGVRSRLERHA
jgi:hypothetical protein